MLANAHVQTEKSSRHLQALCGHFSRKVQADYTPERGHIAFGFGSCDLRAEPGTLILEVQGSDEETLNRLKNVVGSHLERSAVKDELQVVWTDEPVAAGA